ncbi:MAG: aspartate--tRNA ligase [Sphaerochaetaceae bacterium]|nr:aspartate--tRNA ligase [Sphaerochaetaceae bacterium]
MEYKQRTVTCGALRQEDEGKYVVLNGWVHRNRNHGGIHFINLRDRYGITQIVVGEHARDEVRQIAEELRLEYCIAVEGIVRKRPDSMINPNMDTGSIEVDVQSLQILSRCEPLPFMIDEESDAKEDLRLRYRYLDLRSTGMQNRIRLRHEFVKAIREHLSARDFYEIETPTLIKSTPEGARDFLVPSRLYAGKFYALPQSPQLLKQILMVGGFDKYFQIARCYRDEDARGDRQLEFTQLDLEMSFVTREDVLKTIEDLFVEVFAKVMDYSLPTSFRRLSWSDAMNTYGVDKPDVRYDLPLIDIGDLAESIQFGAFQTALAEKGSIKAICAPASDNLAYSRKYIGELEEAAKVYGAKGLAFVKVGKGGALESGIAKFLVGHESAIIERMKASEGDMILFIAAPWKKCCNSLGAVRTKLARDLNIIDKNRFEFCWIIDFPLFEFNEEAGHWEAAHHMFSMPQAQYIPTLESDPGSVKGDLYDLVLNGYEVASGSIRIHDVELQKRIFRICNFTDEEAESRFGFLLNAFRYGPPPHGGIAPGIDRMVMIMAQQTSIKEVIAFPKNTAAVSPMDDSPSYVDDKQLDELYLLIKQPEKSE